MYRYTFSRVKMDSLGASPSVPPNTSSRDGTPVKRGKPCYSIPPYPRQVGTGRLRNPAVLRVLGDAWKEHPHQHMLSRYLHAARKSPSRKWRVRDEGKTINNQHLTATGKTVGTAMVAPSVEAWRSPPSKLSCGFRNLTLCCTQQHARH